MAFDQSKIGQHITGQMEALEKDFGDDAEIGDICTVVEIIVPQGDETFQTQTRVRFTGRPHVGIGLLRQAEQSLLNMRG
jgi:hypothetical protein